MNEADFISALRKMPLHPGACGLHDDCAILEIGDQSLIITHDAMSQGVHFRSGADLADVAWKLVASNLSDLAAKGAEPIGVLLGHALGQGDERFLDGLQEVLTTFGISLLGGDTISVEGARTFGLTAIGKATHTPVPSRSGAQAGDKLYVTGTLGAAMLGFEGEADYLQAFNRPSPRLAEGQALAPSVSAMMDISDGLLLDAFRLAEASQATLTIAGHQVPVADEKRRDDCMRWGDDYELLFTLPDGVEPSVAATCIGSVEPLGFAPLLLDDNPVVNSQGLGFQH